jgi:hypothetical protein
MQNGKAKTLAVAALLGEPACFPELPKRIKSACCADVTFLK